MTQPLLKSRTARWGLLLSALFLGATLVGVSAFGFRAAQREADFTAQELAGSLGRAVRVALFAGQWPPDAAQLGELVAEYEDLGLRYLALIDHDLAVVAEGGQSNFPIEAEHLRGGRDLIRLGGQLRMVSPAKPLRRDHMGRRHRPGGGMRGDGWLQGSEERLRVVIDFEPVFSRKIMARAGLQLVLSLLAAALLTGATLVFWRLSQRALNAESELEDQRRLAALGEMSAVLAHEIRNPLGSLKGHAQLLREQLEPGTKDYDKADRVVKEAGKLENLTSDLLDFVRSNQVKLSPADPSALMRHAAEVAEDLLGEGESRIELELADAPASWLLDSDRIEQVLVNLLRNALQSLPPSGRVVCRVSVERGQLALEVRDGGAGILPGEEEAIFEPFQTRRVKGVGLGLSVVKRIVEAHGGVIVASNRPPPEVGAVFKVLIPGGETTNATRTTGRG
jgi:two-component system sensor histidine kinase HydH